MALRVRSAGDVVCVPVLGVVGSRPMAANSSSPSAAASRSRAWKGCLARGLRHPVRRALKDSTSHRPAASVLHRRLPHLAQSGSGDVRPGSGA